METLLDLNDDALFSICNAIEGMDHVDLLSFSSTCTRLRTCSAPLIFRRPRLVHRNNIQQWLKFVGSSPMFLRYTRNVDIILLVARVEDAMLLRHVLCKFRSLQELRLRVPNGNHLCPENLKKAFQSCDRLELQRFTISAGLEDLIPTVTITKALQILNVEQLPHRYVDIDGLQKQITQGHLKQIRSLRLGGSRSWSPALLQACTAHLPLLNDLGIIRGNIPGHCFESLLQQPGLCPGVTTIRISEIKELALRYYLPVCTKNICRPPIRFCPRHAKGALYYAGKLLFMDFAGLECFNLPDGSCVTCDRGEDGAISGLYISSATAACVSINNRTPLFEET